MKICPYSLVFLLAMSLPGSRLNGQQTARTPTASADRTTDEQTIRRLNEEWLKAWDAGDVAALDRIEDDEYTGASDFGERNKQQQLDLARHRAEKSTVVNRIIEKQHFRFYGDVALLTELDRYPDNNESYQSTSVWVRRNGVWKPVHLHYTRLAKKS